MKNNYLLSVVAVMLLLSGCGSSASSSAEAVSVPSVESTEAASKFSVESTDAASESSVEDNVVENTDYKKAYAEIVQSFKSDESPTSYDLIYVDEDDIPELVVGNPGYWVSLYSFKNDQTYCLMDQWAYGAMGNSGYTYAPKKNVLYNGNADYAGSIYYNSYMSINDGGELATSYWSMDINFDDVNGDEIPSEEELETAEGRTYDTKYYSEINKDMSEEDIKKIIDEYSAFEYEQIEGTQDYNSIMEQLTN